MQQAAVTIIGSGMAAYFLAMELRRCDAKIPIIILCENDGRFYPKPGLSSALYNQKKPAQLVTASAAAMAEKYDLQIETFAKVEQIDDTKQQLFYQQNGQQKHHAYQQLVLATGSKPKAIAIPGAELCYRVNSLEDYERLLPRLQTIGKITIIGAGLVGVEFAHDCIHAGYAVEMIAANPEALPGLVPASAGRRIREHLCGLGVRWHNVSQIDRIVQAQAGLQIHSPEMTHNADIILLATGLSANTDLTPADQPQWRGPHGFIVDRYARLSAKVYALGDCACIDSSHFTYVAPIKKQVAALAQTLLGKPTTISYPPMPVGLKTPTLPCSIIPVRIYQPGKWEDIQVEQDTYVSVYRDQKQQVHGVVLIGKAVASRDEWIAKMPPYLPGFAPDESSKA